MAQTRAEQKRESLSRSTGISLLRNIFFHVQKVSVQVLCRIRLSVAFSSFFVCFILEKIKYKSEFSWLGETTNFFPPLNVI